MTNDIADAEDMPDMIYLSNGEIEPVSMVIDAEMNKISDTDYALKVISSKPGWSYGNITDTTYGMAGLKGVKRQSDGKEISLRNFWQRADMLMDAIISLSMVMMLLILPLQLKTSVMAALMWQATE